MTEKLKSELLELERRVNNVFELSTSAQIQGLIELSSDPSIPYTFECEALHPGFYKGWVVPEEEIVKAQKTIFNVNEPFRNDEINLQHKSIYKQDSTPRDLVGRVTNARYDSKNKVYKIKGQIFDKEIARKIANGLLNYVSISIFPHRVEYNGIRKIARELEFKELSLVRAPGDEKAYITKR